MPARKPQSLSQRHSTADEIENREAAEAAITPTTQLTATPPAFLRKHKVAKETWKRLVGLYFETKQPLVTAFDADLLAKYCLLEEECLELEKMRLSVSSQAVSLQKKLSKVKLDTVDHMKAYYSLLEQYNALMTRYQGLDARLDGKRKLSHALSQSMYLTPRSRAGAVPTEKPSTPDDEFGAKFD